MLDAILLEQQGVPAIAVITEPFRETGRAMAETWGLPGFRFLETPHPIANAGDKELDRRADRLLEAVVALLTGSADSAAPRPAQHADLDNRRSRLRGGS